MSVPIFVLSKISELREEFFKMATKRLIDEAKQTIKIEFSDGQTFGPIKLDEITDVLTRMIGALDGRIARLEAQVRNG